MASFLHFARYPALAVLIASVIIGDIQLLFPGVSNIKLEDLPHVPTVFRGLLTSLNPRFAAAPETGGLRNYALQKTEINVLLGELDHRISTLERERINDCQSSYTECCMKSPKTSEDPENPVIGTFHTGEVRRMGESWGHTSKMVSFPSPYSQRPGIPVALMWLEIGNNQNVRVKCYSSKITETYFEISIDTWAGTSLYQASCAWMEIGANHPQFQFGTYSTLEDHAWYDYRVENIRNVIFSRPYTTPPRVVVWLSSIDMGYDHDWRVKAYATHVTAEGFTIHIDTWGDSELHTAAASWVAYPLGKAGVFDGSFGIGTSASHEQSGQLPTSGYTEFGKDVFSLPPRTMLGISSFHIQCGHNLRLAVGTTSVGASGMTWYLNSWGDTILHSATASYIALS